ncbi:uncharacterized protein N7473_000507 [Penicillium subrubescens]|uniref:uncharacterized protein n=1 Tax=Penicillium subrubescens TaxID=1316194 RepID=UPI0025452B14|nr:uncharacterized protein N7473_000507 [Penicillium subrubescens]KAJ5911204.1 hypothetical protein N7473_000507 [Penicillium subrubescens]
MQFNTIITTICLALISGTVTAESTPVNIPTPAVTPPSQSASPSFTRSIQAAASRSATPTVQPTHPYLKRTAATAASSVHVSSTPVAPSGFKTSAMPAASSAGIADILGGLLNLPLQ